MGLVDELRQLSEQVRKRQAHVKGEEATKQALVLPFFQVLGYDVYDPTEVRPEYVADFAVDGTPDPHRSDGRGRGGGDRPLAAALG